MTQQAIQEISVKQPRHLVHGLPLISASAFSAICSGVPHLDESVRILTVNRNRYVVGGLWFTNNSTIVEIQVVISRFTMARSLLTEQCRRCGGPGE